ncbi:MAG TPA: flagellar protein FlaG [Caulobacteraceae bacterium]|jgi:flagellar protein FlaG|nr:flagellar protein FlaG [Caulobacteraceae bacterium]
MAANVDKVASVALSLNQSSKQQVADPKPQETVTPADTPAPAESVDYRFVIEEDAAARTFVYKTIDRSTGKVISQYPREELLKLMEDPSYKAGAVLKTQV